MKVHAVRVRRVAGLHLAALVLALQVGIPSAAAAAELPSFRKGVWEFKRTIEGQGSTGKGTAMSSRKCIDPSADMKRMNELLARQGCKFSPVAVNGNVYSYSADCQLMGAAVKSHSALTAESEDSYTLRVTSSGSTGSTREVLVARRIGDC